MRNKIRLFFGWFGVLTPVYAAGVLTVLFATGPTELGLIGKVVAVSFINLFVGYKILKAEVKEGKSPIVGFEGIRGGGMSCGMPYGDKKCQTAKKLLKKK